MRGLLPHALALLSLSAILACVPSAAAQPDVTAAPPIDVFTDAASDAAVPGAGVAFPAGSLRSFDLLGLGMADDEASVTFDLSVAGFYSGLGDTFEGQGALYAHFFHGEVEFRLAVEQQCDDGACWWATLERWSEPSQMYIWVAGVDPVEDGEAGRLSVTVPKAGLADEDGAAPFRTRVLGSLWVEAVYRPLGEPVGSVDRMPDTGEGEYAIRGGLPQAGGVALWSSQPFRASNGEATTYVYTVNVENHGPRGVFRLQSDGMPAGWDVQFPQATVEVGAGETLPVPVLATVPFAHDHGTQPSFLVHLYGDGEPSRHGQLRLGVLYTDPPQPAGHHSDVYFHSGAWGGLVDGPLYGTGHMPGRSWIWMNTLEDDGSDEGVGVPAYAFQQQGSTSVRYGWFPWLDDLDIGLDLDLSKPVRLNLPLATDVPLPSAQVQADLYATWRTGDGGWESVRLASLSSETADLAAGATRLYQLEGLPTPDADRIEPHKDMSLSWNVFLTAQRPAAQLAGYTPASPSLMPGGSSHLPLLEYHDPVDEVFAALDGVRLQADGPSSRLVNPGETVLFNLTLRNDAQEGGFHLGLRGEHAPWARVLGGDRVHMQGGGRERVTVAVTAPADASDGQAIDLLVEAHGPGGAAALLRLGGQVVTGTDVPDESGLVPGLDASRESPAPPLAWLALAVLAVAWLRRRPA